MLRGIYIYRCSKCGHKFWAADIEWQCTAASQPVKCPKCGSYHTSIDSWATMKAFGKGGIALLKEKLGKDKKHE